MHAFGTSASVAPLRARARPRGGAPARRASATRVSASSRKKESSDASRREVLAAPGLAALFGSVAAEQLWFPGAALAKTPAALKGAAAKTSVGIKPVSVGYDEWTTDLSAFGPPAGPLGGAVGCEDYAAFKPVIRSFIDGIKSGECPPWAKDATRGWLLREEGGNRVMLTILVPAGQAQRDGLAFFIDSGPKANPFWKEQAWLDRTEPIQATASVGFLIRGAPPPNMTGRYFGQYRLGWNGRKEDWTPLFVSKEATDFHNSVGIPFSVAHEIVKAPGNTYKTKAKTGIEVFHLINSKAGGDAMNAAFAPDSPFFKEEKRYVGPYESILWKIEEDIVFKA